MGNCDSNADGGKLHGNVPVVVIWCWTVWVILKWLSETKDGGTAEILDSPWVTDLGGGKKKEGKKNLKERPTTTAFKDIMKGVSFQWDGWPHPV